MSKRKREVEPEICKTNFIKSDDFENNPKCPHGPQIEYERNGKRFFACSAFRDKKECEKNASKVADKQSNSGLAQYIFSEEATDLFVEIIKQIKCQNVLCLGAPSVHSKLLKVDGLNSLLLDLDIDMVSKHQDTSSHYNMCNHHFFSHRDLYEQFLKNSSELTIIMDPPFSAKPEVLSHVHHLISQDFQRLSPSPSAASPSLFWIAPYFLEGHIKKSNSALEMSDYQVNYSNHASFSKGRNKSRKHGSPIRFFTNVPLNLIKLPDASYKFCSQCNKYVVKSNRHCDPCGTCTSKDGQTYEHCWKCSRCVKPTWSHCSKCQKCVLTVHECQQQMKQKCHQQLGQINKKGNVKCRK